MKVIRFDQNNCKRIRAFLDSYLNSELLIETAHEVLRHLADCRECAALLAERERLKVRLQAAVRREVAPANLSQRIQKSIRQNRRREWSQWLVGIAALLAVAAGLAGVLRWWTRPPGDGARAQTVGRRLYPQGAEPWRTGRACHHRSHPLKGFGQGSAACFAGKGRDTHAFSLTSSIHAVEASRPCLPDPSLHRLG